MQGSIGTNPCAEIILQSKQFCNLSEVIARAYDTETSLLRKARLAAILGTYQSTLTKFGYISQEWTDHCKTERLLGVSITGQWDSPVVRQPEVMRKVRDMADKTNATYAKRFGVERSMAVTAVKPRALSHRPLTAPRVSTRAMRRTTFAVYASAQPTHSSSLCAIRVCHIIRKWGSHSKKRIRLYLSSQLRHPTTPRKRDLRMTLLRSTSLNTGSR